VLRVLDVTDIWDSFSVIDETFCIAPRPVSGKLRECFSTGFPGLFRAGTRFVVSLLLLSVDLVLFCGA
jgi:hypothetical protein